MSDDRKMAAAATEALRFLTGKPMTVHPDEPRFFGDGVFDVVGVDVGIGCDKTVELAVFADGKGGYYAVTTAPLEGDTVRLAPPRPTAAEVKELCDALCNTADDTVSDQVCGSLYGAAYAIRRRDWRWAHCCLDAAIARTRKPATEALCKRALEFVGEQRRAKP